MKSVSKWIPNGDIFEIFERRCTNEKENSVVIKCKSGDFGFSAPAAFIRPIESQPTIYVETGAFLCTLSSKMKVNCLRSRHPVTKVE